MKDDLNNHYDQKMLFDSNPNKPAEVVILTNRNITSYETVSYSGVDIQPVESHKPLGFVLDSKMSYI